MTFESETHQTVLNSSSLPVFFGAEHRAAIAERWCRMPAIQRTMYVLASLCPAPYLGLSLGLLAAPLRRLSAKLPFFVRVQAILLALESLEILSVLLLLCGNLVFLLPRNPWVFLSWRYRLVAFVPRQ